MRGLVFESARCHHRACLLQLYQRRLLLWTLPAATVG